MNRMTASHADLGRAHLQSGRIAEAVESLRRAIDLNASDAAAHFYLGLALESQGRIPDAIAALSRAVALAPKLAQGHAKLARLMLSAGDRPAAIASYRRASAAAPATELGRLCLARALMEEDKHTEAEQWLRDVIALHPQNGAAAGMLGTVLAEVGRFDEAATYYARAIEVDPRQVAFYYELVRCRRLTEAERPLLERMRTALRAPGLSARDRVSLYLALGKALDDLGDPGEAMRCWGEASRVKSVLAPFDRADFARRIDALIATFTPALFAAHAASRAADATPVLVVGMPRSGTTLVEQILSSHRQVGAAGELDDWDRIGGRFFAAPPAEIGPFLRQAAGAYLERLRGAAPHAPRVTDKMPHNFVWTGLIHLVFPQARFIHCHRHPVDTCISIFSTFFGPRRNFSTEPQDLVFYYRQYQRLMAHWRAVIPGDRLMDVEYEALIAAPEPTVRRMLDFCALDWDAACLQPERNPRAVKTASKWQARQPINRGSVGRWRRYEPWLGAFRELLAPQEAAT